MFLSQWRRKTYTISHMLMFTYRTWPYLGSRAFAAESTFFPWSRWRCQTASITLFVFILPGVLMTVWVLMAPGVIGSSLITHTKPPKKCFVHRQIPRKAGPDPEKHLALESLSALRTPKSLCGGKALPKPWSSVGRKEEKPSIFSSLLEREWAD